MKGCQHLALMLRSHVQKALGVLRPHSLYQGARGRLGPPGQAQAKARRSKVRGHRLVGRVGHRGRCVEEMMEYQGHESLIPSFRWEERNSLLKERS